MNLSSAIAKLGIKINKKDVHSILHHELRGNKLLQKPHIVFRKKADVIDVVLQHRDAFDAHAEGKARILF